MKRPSDEALVRNLLENTDVLQFMADMWSNDELIEIAMNAMTERQMKNVADDEWDDICYEADLEAERRAWENGRYS